MVSLLLAVNDGRLLKSSFQELVPWTSEYEVLICISLVLELSLIGFKELYSQVKFSIDGECHIALLERAKFGVKKAVVVALCFLVSKRVTRPEDSITVIDVDNLETDES